MDSGNAQPSPIIEVLRKQLVNVQRDYHQVLAENAMLKEQNYQLSQYLNLVVSRLTQLGYRVEPPFEINSQIKRVREIREDALKKAAAASAVANAALGIHLGGGGGGAVASLAGGGGLQGAGVPPRRRNLLTIPTLSYLSTGGSGAGGTAAGAAVSPNSERPPFSAASGLSQKDDPPTGGGVGGTDGADFPNTGISSTSTGINSINNNNNYGTSNVLSGASPSSSLGQPLQGAATVALMGATGIFSGERTEVPKQQNINTVGGGPLTDSIHTTKGLAGGAAATTGSSAEEKLQINQASSSAGGGPLTLQRPLFPRSRFRCVAELKEHKSHVQSAAFSPYFGEDSSGGSGPSSSVGGASSGLGSSSPLPSGPPCYAFLATGAFDSRINIWRIPSSVMHLNPLRSPNPAGSTGSLTSAGVGGSVASAGKDRVGGEDRGGTAARGGDDGYSGGSKGQQSYPAPARYSSVASIVNGHSRNVCALSWCRDYSGYLISSSFDGTSRVWNVEGCTGLKTQSPPAPVHSISAYSGAYMVANCALAGLSYACADSRNMAYVVDFRANASGNAGQSASSAGVSFPAGGIGIGGGVVSWANASRVTSLCGDERNPNMLITGFANGTVKVWDLRLTSQAVASSTALSINNNQGGSINNNNSSTSSSAPPPSDEAMIAAGGSTRFAVLGALDRQQNGGFPFKVVSEWSNDESKATVWHLALATASSRRPASIAAGSEQKSSYDSSLLTISEDGMARIYSVKCGEGGGEEATDLSAGTTSNTMSSVYKSLSFSRSLRTLVPGIHSRGMPVNASLWLGATYGGTNSYLYSDQHSDQYRQRAGHHRHTHFASDEDQRQGHHGGGGERLGERHRHHDETSGLYDDDDDDDAPSSPLMLGRGDEDRRMGVLGMGRVGVGSSLHEMGGRIGSDINGLSRPLTTTLPHESDLLIVGSSTGNASVYDVTNPDDPILLEHLEGHKSLVTGVSALPPSERWRKPLIATYSHDNNVRLYTSVVE